MSSVDSYSHQMRNHYLASGHPTLQISSDIPDEFDDPMDHTALAYDFAEQAYSLWLDSSDEDSRDLMVEPKQTLEERYGKIIELTIRPISRWII